MRTELEQQHSIEMEQLTREHQQELFAARMELERALELTKQKVGSVREPTATGLYCSVLDESKIEIYTDTLYCHF